MDVAGYARLVNTNMSCYKHAVVWAASEYCHKLLLFLSSSSGGSRTGQLNSVTVGLAERGGGG